MFIYVKLFFNIYNKTIWDSSQTFYWTAGKSTENWRQWIFGSGWLPENKVLFGIPTQTTSVESMETIDFLKRMTPSISLCFPYILQIWIEVEWYIVQDFFQGNYKHVLERRISNLFQTESIRIIKQYCEYMQIQSSKKRSLHSPKYLNMKLPIEIAVLWYRSECKSKFLEFFMARNIFKSMTKFDIYKCEHKQ